MDYTFMFAKAICFIFIIGWMIWEKYFTPSNIVALIIVPLPAILIEVFYGVNCYDLLVIPSFFLLRKLQKQPLWTNDSIFSLLAILTFQAYYLLGVMFVIAASSGDM